MTYTLQIRAEAIEETGEAYSWYESKQQGLGERFLSELQHIYYNIQDAPLKYKQSYRGVRIAVMPVFPFLIIFTLKETEIVVHSVFHTSRNPKSWRTRVRKKN